MNYNNIEHTTTNVSLLTLLILTYGYNQTIYSYDIYFNHMDYHSINNIKLYDYDKKNYTNHYLPNDVFIKQIIKTGHSFVDYYNYLIILTNNGIILFTCNNYAYDKNTVIIANINIDSMYLHNDLLYITTKDGTLRCINIDPFLTFETDITHGRLNEIKLNNIYLNIQKDYDNILCIHVHKFILNAFDNRHIVVTKDSSYKSFLCYDNNDGNRIIVPFNFDASNNSYIKLCCNTKHYTIAALNNDKLMLFKYGNNNKKIIYLDQFIIKNIKITDICIINSNLYLLYSNGSLYEYTTFYDQFELSNCTHNTNIVSLYCGKEIIDINDGYNFCNILNTENDMDKNYVAMENIKIIRKISKL